MDTIKLKREEMKELIKEAQEEYREERNKEDTWIYDFALCGAIYGAAGCTIVIALSYYEALGTWGAVGIFAFVAVLCILLSFGEVDKMKIKRLKRKLEAK